MHYSLEARLEVVNSIIILLACKPVVHLGDIARKHVWAARERRLKSNELCRSLAGYYPLYNTIDSLHGERSVSTRPLLCQVNISFLTGIFVRVMQSPYDKRSWSLTVFPLSHSFSNVDCRRGIPKLRLSEKISQAISLKDGRWTRW